MVGQPIDELSRRAYRDIFNFQPMSNFLTRLISDLGSDHFQGVMKPWVKQKHYHVRLQHLLNWAVAPLLTPV